MNKFLGLVALMASALPSIAADDASTKAAIQKVEDKIIAAMKSADLGYLKSVLTDDFKVVDGKKSYTKSQWVEITSKTLKAVKIKTISMHLVSIHITGNVATLQTKSSMTGTVTVPSAGKPQVLVDNSSDEETWVKTPNGWKFKKDVTLAETATLDGKPISE